VAVPPGDDSDATVGTLLLSHVLTELSEQEIKELVQVCSRATTIVWVEPGTRETSRRLSQVREQLRQSFQVVAPCTHQNPCGMLCAGSEAHWCHHFATPPPEVFTSAFWRQFSEWAGVDLRSLPLSYLVMDKRPCTMRALHATRLIGRPRVYKAHALVFGCDASGVHEKRLSKRHLPQEFKQLKKGEQASLQMWHCQDEEIIKVESAEASADTNCAGPK
jgi:ribosomal protein RSM22 (predicted rRNA methylase)